MSKTFWLYLAIFYFIAASLFVPSPDKLFYALSLLTYGFIALLIYHEKDQARLL
jgi:hypothetical protein